MDKRDPGASGPQVSMPGLGRPQAAQARRDRDQRQVRRPPRPSRRLPAGARRDGPGRVKDRLAFTLRRLGTDYVDIYRPARLNPNVPIEDTVGAIAEMIQAGYVRYAGLSEVGAARLRKAATVHPISDLQIEYSLLSRGIEDEILPTARELGTGITAYGVLSRGLLSGHWSPARRPATTSAGTHPGFRARTWPPTSRWSTCCARWPSRPG